jgi:phage-related protein
MWNTRSIRWLKAARKEFEAFPGEVQLEMMRALSVASEGEKADIAKPFKGVDGGVFEIAVKHRGGRLPLHLCRADRRRCLGRGCVSEKIQKRNQNATNGRKQD